MTFAPNFKPSRLARDVAKWERQETRQETRKKNQRAMAAAWAKRSAECCARDRGVCRVCTCQTTKWGKGDPRLWPEVHHIIYRSAGGSDDMSNLILLCRRCHDDEHMHKIWLSGTAANLRISRIA